MLLAFALLALATARPEMDVRVPRENATVVVTVDVSTSMKATDVEPNRLDAAARAARRFVEDLPEGFNVGIVTFSGRTTIRATPTADRATALAALERPHPRRPHRDRRGRVHLPRRDPRPGQAQRRGEGARPRGAPLRRHQHHRAHARGGGCGGPRGRRPVSTIAYGTPDGVVETQGQLVGVPVDEETLATLAEDTDGTAYTAQSSDELNEVYDDIQSSIGWRTEPREVTPYVTAIALCLGLLAAALSLRWFTRIP